jgi:hypothetical protein
MFDKFKTWLRVKPQKEQPSATTFYAPPTPAASPRPSASPVSANKPAETVPESAQPRAANLPHPSSYPTHFPSRPTSSTPNVNALQSSPPVLTGPRAVSVAPPLPVAPSSSARPHAAVPALAQAPAASKPLATGYTGEVLMVPWSSVSSKWPQEVRQCIELTGVVPKALNLPIQRVETLLKKGRVVFPWSELRQWIDPASPALHPAFPDDTPIEIPASLVAPLFFARMRPAEKAKEGATIDSIPDLFSKRTEPSAAAVAPVQVERADRGTEALVSPRDAAPPQPQVALPKPEVTTEVSAALEASTPPAAESGASSEVIGEPVTVPWKDLVSKLPDELREIFARQPISPKAIAFPLSMVESGLKRGKVRFSWTQICGWFSPQMPSFARVLAPETMVDIPLPLIAPLFLAKAKNIPAARPLTPREEIPDLFPLPGSRLGAQTIEEFTPPTPTQEVVAAVPQPQAAPEFPPSIIPSELPGLSMERQPIVPEPSRTPVVSAGTLPAASTPSADHLRFAWQDIWAKWPESVRGRMATIGTNVVAVDVPIAAIEAGLRRGKIEVKWADFRSWLVPPSSGLEEALPVDLNLEIPLSLAAPRFLSLRQSGNAPRREIVVPDDIPSPFASVKAPVAESPPIPVAELAKVPEVSAPVKGEPRSEPTLDVVPPAAAAASVVRELAEPVPAQSSDTLFQVQLPAAMLVASLAPASIQAGPDVLVPLEELTSSWTPSARNGLRQPGGATHHVRIPVGRVEDGLRKGSLQVALSELRQWVMPPLLDLPGTPGTDPILELSLPALAQAYLRLRSCSTEESRHDSTGAATDRVTSLSETGKSLPAVLGPLEFVELLAGCRGVSGTVLASSDGLLVGSRVPEGFDPEAMAAVLPRLYSHTLDMGRPFEIADTGEVELGFRNLKVHIFCRDGFYAGVFGQNNQLQSLPEIRQLMKKTQLR